MMAGCKLLQQQGSTISIITFYMLDGVRGLVIFKGAPAVTSAMGVIFRPRHATPRTTSCYLEGRKGLFYRYFLPTRMALTSPIKTSLRISMGKRSRSSLNQRVAFFILS